MDAISRDVTSLSPTERHVFEGVLGQSLEDHQRVVVSLEEKYRYADHTEQPFLRDQKVTIKREGDVGILPDWCAIFADLSDEEFAEIEEAILTRADLSRPTDPDD